MPVKPFSLRSRFIAVALFAFTVAASVSGEANEGDTQALVQELGKTKLTLLDGIRQASKGSAAAISAKFEMDDGKLSLSVYTAEKGLRVPAEQNVLQELSGSPEGDKWEPKVEVFKDVPHVSRSSEQLTVMSLGHRSLADLVASVQKARAGTVFSVTGSQGWEAHGRSSGGKQRQGDQAHASALGVRVYFTDHSPQGLRGRLASVAVTESLIMFGKR
jgi:hypothetical protein